MIRRQEIVDKIISYLSFARIQLEYKQSRGVYSLNHYGENFFRDVFNFLFSINLENTNDEMKNAPFIDLIDRKNKIAYQITTNSNSSNYLGKILLN